MTHSIRTTMRPDQLITVSDDEYERLLQMGLIYTGTAPATPTDYYDQLFADKVQNGVALPAALRAAYGRAAPVMSNFVYDLPGTGNLLSYQEDGITITLTYNSDGTVHTSKRGTDATQTYSYTAGNLSGVA